MKIIAGSMTMTIEDEFAKYVLVEQAKYVLVEQAKHGDRNKGRRYTQIYLDIPGEKRIVLQTLKGSWRISKKTDEAIYLS